MNDFDKHFNSMSKFIMFFQLVVLGIVITVLGGTGFVVYKLLEYFNVL